MQRQNERRMHRDRYRERIDHNLNGRNDEENSIDTMTINMAPQQISRRSMNYRILTHQTKVKHCHRHMRQN